MYVPVEGTMNDPTYTDIMEQAVSLSGTLQVLENMEVPSFAVQPEQVYVFTGCGASYYVAQSAAAFMRALGNSTAIAVPSSEAWLLPDLWLQPGCIAVGISRSGTTTEVLRALEQARARQLPTIAISLAAVAPIYDLADMALRLPHVQEAGRVMTRSFANLLLATQWLAASVAHAHGHAAGTHYRQALRHAVDMIDATLPMLNAHAHALAHTMFDEYVVLGSSPLAGIGAQAALQMQEMTRLACASYAGLEYRHGPIATLTPQSLVMILASPRTAAFDALLARDVQTLGGTAVVVGPESEAAVFPSSAQMIGLPAGLPDWLYGNVALPLLQLLAFHATVARGNDPQSVHHLDKRMLPHIDPHTVDVNPGAGDG